MENIRNFVIIAHIDHGKSTLADRFLEITGTVDSRHMRPQYLDRMELERERGITIKMAPVRMIYKVNHAEARNSKPEILNKLETPNSKSLEIRNSKLEIAKSEYVLNLIDTPGHSDFAYEVSRALAAVEGAILLVDATKGIQAQTLSNFRAARKAGLKIIGAVNKIDLLQAQTNADSRLNKVVRAAAELLGVREEEIFKISAKTGKGVRELLDAVIKRVPAPRTDADFSPTSADNLPRESAMPARALIFDSLYDDHKGILAFMRVFSGEFSAGETVQFLASGAKAKIKEVGYFSPDFKTAQKISAGEIGYIATGLKESALIKIGDTIITQTNAERTRTDADNFPHGSALSPRESASLPLPGYKEPLPVVFISFYPDRTTKFEDLKKGLERLRLNDSSLSFEPDANEALGRGLKVGFLGQLHFEITASRLKREFGVDFITSFPSIAYRILLRNTADQRGHASQTSAGDSRRQSAIIVKQPQDFPDNPEKVWQPMIRVEILTPQSYLNQVVNLKNIFDLEVLEIKNLGENLILEGRMPLAELIRDFDDQLKSASAGFASMSYEFDGETAADVEKLEILVVGEVLPALTRIVPKKDLEREARRTVERLKKLLPREQWSQPIQAKAQGRIIARETIPALRKDVTGYLYGGDRSRKMKLWKKQQRGKKKLEKMAAVNISPEVFREILKK